MNVSSFFSSYLTSQEHERKMGRGLWKRVLQENKKGFQVGVLMNLAIKEIIRLLTDKWYFLRCIDFIMGLIFFQNYQNESSSITHGCATKAKDMA